MHHLLSVCPPTDDAEDLDIVVMMYNLLDYSSNYHVTRGSLCFCSKDEAANFDSNTANDDDFRSFKYKANLL